VKVVKTWSTPVTEEKSRLIPCVLCGGLSFKPHLHCEGFSYVRCTGCGLVMMNPQPLGTEVEKRYGENYGGDYLSYERANEEQFLRLQLLALKDAGFFRQYGGAKKIAGEAKRVLDIGCATGALLENLRDRGWETTGVEICKGEAEYARQERKLDVRDLPLEENNFAPERFDAVLASHLIEHLNDPGAFCGEVYRVLAPGGCFLVTTPNIAGFQARLFKDRWRSAIFDHLFLFSVKTLSRLLVKAGFSVEKIVTWGGLAAGAAPDRVKRFFDKAAKRFGFGDVALIRARKEGGYAETRRLPQPVLELFKNFGF
jgi:2-polyprenyl-3-methyl-5-hydroxy-6-metoxy-1,4-benzoquinol methylase